MEFITGIVDGAMLMISILILCVLDSINKGIMKLNKEDDNGEQESNKRLKQTQTADCRFCGGKCINWVCVDCGE